MFWRGINDRIAVMYLADIVESAISDCNFDCQTTGFSPSAIMNPVLDCTLVGSFGSSFEYNPAKSASTQQLSWGIPVHLQRIIPLCAVDFR